MDALAEQSEVFRFVIYWNNKGEVHK